VSVGGVTAYGSWKAKLAGRCVERGGLYLLVPVDEQYSSLQRADFALILLRARSLGGGVDHGCV